MHVGHEDPGPLQTLRLLRMNLSWVPHRNQTAELRPLGKRQGHRRHVAGRVGTPKLVQER